MHQDPSEEDEFESLDNSPSSTPNEVLSEPQAERAQTRALTRLLHERHTINFVEADLRAQLSRICVHLYRNGLSLASLPQADQLLWNSFSVEDIHFFLSGQREHTPDYSEYLKIYKAPQQFVSLPNSPSGSSPHYRRCQSSAPPNQAPDSHQFLFNQIGKYATDAHYMHFRLPIHLNHFFKFLRQ
jgi:hypothetical protein